MRYILLILVFGFVSCQPAQAGTSGTSKTYEQINKALDVQEKANENYRKSTQTAYETLEYGAKQHERAKRNNQQRKLEQNRRNR